MTPEPQNARTLNEVQGKVAFEQVSFSYVPQRPLIRDFSLEVSPGTTVAIVGPTGAGKTTLVNLLMRFYETDRGQITVDDSPITDVTRDSLRRCFGMVLQDTWLFSGTVRDNIAYGREDATDEEVEAAAVPPMLTGLSADFPRDIRPSFPRMGEIYLKDNGSCSPSPALCCSTHPCLFWMRPPARWTFSPS